jgi:hypothetical protein
MRDKDIVEVYAAADVPEAYLVKNRLESMGIRARVVDEPLYGAAGALPVGVNTCPRVWVSQADSARARQIIADQETERRAAEASVSARPWVCPQCGSQIPANFDTCWKCEYLRAST